MKHGEKRRKKIRVGGREVIIREIYCRLHGFLNAFWIGEDEGFEAKHASCDQPPTVRGAAFEKALVKTV